MLGGFVRELFDLDESEKVSLEILRLELKGRIQSEDMLADHLRVLKGRIRVGLERAHVLGELPSLELLLTTASLTLFKATLNVELSWVDKHVADRHITIVDDSIDVPLCRICIVIIVFLISRGCLKCGKLFVSRSQSILVNLQEQFRAEMVRYDATYVLMVEFFLEILDVVHQAFDLVVFLLFLRRWFLPNLIKSHSDVILSDRIRFLLLSSFL